MELSNTSLQLERVATFLTRLNKATEKYNQDIRYIRMIQKECIPVLENPQEHISADSDSWMPNEAFFKG